MSSSASTSTGPAAAQCAAGAAEVLRLAADGVAAARRRGRPVLVSWTSRVDLDGDPIARWAAVRARVDRSFYWSSAWSGRRILAAGTVLDIGGRGPSRFAAAQRDWHALSEAAVCAGGRPTLVGGFAFRPAPSGQTTGPAGMPDALLWVPAGQLSGDAGGWRVTVNALVHPAQQPQTVREEMLACAARLTAPLAATMPDRAAPPGARPTVVLERPAPRQWQGLVREAVDAIRAGAFDKVVLARQVDLLAEEPFDLAGALRSLSAEGTHATVFAVELAGRCFLGGTPELLAAAAGGEVRTMALAGSAPRGSSPARDAELARGLLASAKDRHEHALVVARLAAVLGEHCDGVWQEAAPAVLPLTHVQHLRTALGASQRSAALLELVGALHPTPALGGYPSVPALRWLDAREPLDRGWYAAPVGWVDSSGDGEFAVAIRAALVRGASASLYAGCGVVSDSVPASEYRETQAKLRGMLAALGARPAGAALEQRAAPAGPAPVARLHLNESAEGPSLPARRAARSALATLARYPDPARADLAAAVAEQWAVPPEAVLVGNGSDELVLLCALALGRRDRPGLTTAATFPGYRVCLQTLGRGVREVPLTDARVPAAALAEALPDAGVAFVCNPHNPTGGALGRAEMDLLAAASATSRVPVVFDEAYMEFAPRDTPAAREYLDEAPVVVLRTFSKAHGLAGLRVGYAVGPPELVAQVRRAQAMLPFSVTAPAQAAALAALGDPLFLERTRARTARRRARFCAELTRRGRPFLPSVTNFVTLPVADSAAAQARLAQDHGLLTRDVGPAGLADHLRISLGRPGDLDRLLDALDSVDPLPALRTTA